jgi:deferrochelatase/peroxidase EfeB
LLGAAGGLLALPAARAAAAGDAAATEPFHGPHQGGILTVMQSHTCFAAFDLAAGTRADVADLFRRWTTAAERLTEGRPAEVPPPDPLDVLGLGPARLTLTFGFGAGLFADRFGLAGQRPAALVDLPRFNGDQLIEAKTGGDVSVQACADDPQVAFHAVRRLAAIGGTAVKLRWMQSGFSGGFPSGETPRNLMGFKDGTHNPLRPPDGGAPGEDRSGILWVGAEGPAWMQGGTYLVARRIRISLEHWDRMAVDDQEQMIGRHKLSGAPLSGRNEFDPLDLDAADADGNPVIPETAHVRLATASSNGGAEILRRPYSYNDGASYLAERWPPWRQGILYDAGLFFLCYQRDPRTGFIRIFEPMAKLDALNQFTTHTGGGLFAVPPGLGPGDWLGQKLLES